VKSKDYSDRAKKKRPYDAMVTELKTVVKDTNRDTDV
jgi:hypothetical protein